MRVHKDIDKAGTVEFYAKIIDERPEGYEDGVPYYGMDRDVVASFTTPRLDAAKRWLRDNLKTYAKLHRHDDILVEGAIDRVTWREVYFENDPRLGLLKLTDDEWECIASGEVWYDEAGKLRISLEEY